MTLLENLQNWLQEELAQAGPENGFVDKPDYPENWTPAMKLKFAWAVKFAQEAHRGVVRKGTNIPYVLHPIEAALIALGLTDDIDTIVAAVLHDIVEDTDFNEEDVALLFGKAVAGLVADESENKREDRPAEETWQIRKEEALAHLAKAPLKAKIICLGDKLSNMRMSVKTFAAKGDKMWDSFNQKDPKKQEWYYATLGKSLEVLKDTKEWQEYKACVRQVFYNLHPVNHFNYGHTGKIFCKREDKLKDNDNLETCSDCPYLFGSLQGEGVECSWNDVTPYSNHYVNNPREEKKRVNTLIKKGVISKG